MKIKMKYIVAQACLVAGASIALTSCNDFLDREPLDQVTPQEYFQTADHLAAYTISKYNSMFSTHSGWNAGTVNNDGGTDNMVVGGYNSTYYEKGIWKVPSNNDNWSNGLSLARYCNYFFEQVLPKYEAGKISGAEDDLKHYIGEMYFMRALIYYNQLRKYGDYPIITEVLPDDEAILIEKSVRQPRNKVARFILEDLDKAIGLMKNQGFMNNNRLNKQCALLIKSRVALYEATFEKYHQGTGRVPGDETWPGKSVHPNFSLDVTAEINFFLDQCMDAASQVADAITLTENTGVFNPLSDSEYSAFCEKIKNDSALLCEIKNNSENNYHNIMKYFEQSGLFEKGKIAVVDSGWMGTVQKTLTALVNGRTDDNIIGYYFGLYRREDDNYKAFLFDVTDAYKYVPTFCNNLFECFCSAPHGMTTGYSECDGKIIPVLSGANAEMVKMAEIQTKTAARFTEYACENENYIPICKMRDISARLLKALMYKPDKQEAEILGAFPFSDDVTEAKIQCLAGNCKGSISNILLPVRIIRKKKGKSIYPDKYIYWLYGSIVLTGCKPAWVYRLSVREWERLRLLRERRKLCR